MRSSRILSSVLLMVIAAPIGAQGATPWAMSECKYRAPVLAFSTGELGVRDAVMSIADIPSVLLINAGKLSKSGSDFRLIEENGKSLPLRVEHLLSDTGDARILFQIDALPSNGRRVLWLYYGNPQAKPGPALDAAKAPADSKTLNAMMGAEEGAEPEQLLSKPALTEWLATHRLIEAQENAGSQDRPAGGNRGRARGARRSDTSTDLKSKLTADVDVQKADYVCWVRYLSAQQDHTPQGTLNLSLHCERTKPVTRAESCGGTPGYRWASIPISVASPCKLHLTADAAGSSAGVDCEILTTDPNYQPDIRDFRGLVWVRWRIDQPAGFRYTTNIESEIDPYRPSFLTTGTVIRFGLLPHDSKLDRKGADCFETGEYSPWTLLPSSTSRQWHSVLLFTPSDNTKVDPNMTVRVEFANRPSPDRIFHITPAESIEVKTDSSRRPISVSLAVRMPTSATLEALNQLETFVEWAKRRLALIEDLHLSPPPHLKRLKVGTWVSLASRVGGGYAQKEMADIAYRGLEALGVNMPSVGGVEDPIIGAMIKKYGMIGTTWTAWANNPDIINNYDGKFAFKDGETFIQRWERLFDEVYRNNAEQAARNEPNTLNASIHINLGDEIGQIAYADPLVKTPQGMAYFRDWLKQHGQTPEVFGAKSWDEVKPLWSRVGISSEEGTPKVKLFYWTRLFQNDCSAQYYRCATNAVKKYFPKAELIAVNYQASPMGEAFIGNGNQMDQETLDFFHFGRIGAFKGVMMEDWVDAGDFGVGAEGLASEMMRAAGRRHNDPLASYLVGGEGIRGEFYGFLMHGIKEIGLYLYGPITNIGPAWGEDPRALKELAEVTREVKKFEDAIADGVIPPRRAAMLIAPTSDWMQLNGIRFLGERQMLYVALAHAGLPVDIVCEEDIVEDHILKNYELLYVIDPQVRDDVQRKIATWVKGGGRLWAGVGAANWNEYNSPSPILDDVFGVSRRRMLTQEECLPAEQTQAPDAKNKWTYNLRVDTLRANGPVLGGQVEIPVVGLKMDCEPTTAQVVGTYSDGKPAALLNTYGKGQALLVGAWAGRAYKEQHYPKDQKTGKKGWSYDGGARALKIITALAGDIPRPVTLSHGGIYTSLWDSPQGKLVFLNNATLCGEPDKSGAINPTVTVTVADVGNVISVESAKLGKREFAVKDGVASFALPLPDADVVLLRK